MISNMSPRICNLTAIFILSALAVSGILATSHEKSNAPTQANVNPSTTTIAPKVISPPLAASKVGNSFGLNLKSLIPSQQTGTTSATKSQASRAEDGQTDGLNVKDPFSDDSLWRIPINFVRDLNEGGSDQMNSKSFLSNPSQPSPSPSLIPDTDDLDDEDELGPSQGSQLAQSSASPTTTISATTDLKTAAGYHYPSHGHHGYGHHYDSGHHNYGGHHAPSDYYGNYFQYASVPHPYAWEFGYRRGNPYHTIERYEHGNGPHFKTKVKWADKHGGYGVHVWDYNHDDHYSQHYGDHGHYGSHGPSSYHGGHHQGHYGGHH